jgi:septal ring factor EnvC (AmiA/AmiB activator)
MKMTIFLINIALTTKMKRLQSEVDRLKQEIQDFTNEHGNLLPPIPHVEVEKKKRKRKKKNEVERNYSCHIDGCQKSYGSENSLNQHMKIKHPDFWNRIKEKEQNLTSVNTFKTPEEIFHKHQQSIMSSGAKANRNYEHFGEMGDQRKIMRGFGNGAEKQRMRRDIAYLDK